MSYYLPVLYMKITQFKLRVKEKMIFIHVIFDNNYVINLNNNIFPVYTNLKGSFNENDKIPQMRRHRYRQRADIKRRPDCLSFECTSLCF